MFFLLRNAQVLKKLILYDNYFGYYSTQSGLNVFTLTFISRMFKHHKLSKNNRRRRIRTPPTVMKLGQKLINTVIIHIIDLDVKGGGTKGANSVLGLKWNLGPAGIVF